MVCKETELNHSDWYKVKSQGSFDLHLPDD